MAAKKENLKDLSKGELDKKLSGLREEMRMLNFKSEGTKSKNVKETMNLRKNIARVLTAINKK